MIVADANLLAYLYLPGPRTEEARSVMSKDGVWVSPALWRSEFRSALAKTIRAGNIDIAFALRVYRDADHQMSARTVEPDTKRVLSLISSSQCSSYDCEYVSLAQELGCSLVTCDSRILSEFPETAVLPAEFIRR